MGGLTDIYDLPGFTPSPQHLQHIRKIQKKKMDQAMDNEWSSWDAAASPSWQDLLAIMVIPGTLIPVVVALHLDLGLRRWRIGRGGSRATRGCRRRCGRARPPPRAVGAERGSTCGSVTWS